jgi:putative oxidoreductase
LDDRQGKVILNDKPVHFSMNGRRLMNEIIRGVISVVGRLLLTAIFWMSAVGQKIPQFNEVTVRMSGAGMPMHQVMLVGAIVFLTVGSGMIIFGYQARLGGLLLLVFLVLATFYFHDFWNLEGEAQQREMIHFFKNLGLMGGMLLVIANGVGPPSFDSRKEKQPVVDR